MSDNVNVSVSGNVMSLIDNGKCLQTEMPCDGCFNCLFYNTYISSAENLILPSHMTARCFEQMFCYCYYLIAAPTLPATTLAEMCYYRMFDGCHRLKIIQKIPSNSEKLIFKCIIHESTEFAVYHMFYGCFGEEGYFTGTPSNNSYFWEE